MADPLNQTRQSLKILNGSQHREVNNMLAQLENKFCHALQLVISCLILLLIGPHRADGQALDSGDEEAWLSSLSWIDDQNLVATQSQGLLLRPGKLIQITFTGDQSDNSENGDQQETQHAWKVLGETETSLWSVVPVEGGFIGSDYKGRLLKFSQQEVQSQEVQSMELDARWIRKLASVPDEPNQLLAGTEDGKLIVWSVDSNSELKRLDLAAAAIFDIAFRPDASQVAVSCGDGSIHLLDWPGLTPGKVLKGGEQAVWSILYSSDGRYLISGGADRKVRSWDVVEGQQRLVIANARDWVTSLVALPETSLIAAGCLNGEILLIDYVTLLPVETFQSAASGIWAMGLSPNGKQLAVGTRRNGLVLVNDLTPWYEAAQAAERVAVANRPPEPPAPDQNPSQDE